MHLPPSHLSLLEIHPMQLVIVSRTYKNRDFNPIVIYVSFDPFDALKAGNLASNWSLQWQEVVAVHPPLFGVPPPFATVEDGVLSPLLLCPGRENGDAARNQ